MLSIWTFTFWLSVGLIAYVYLGFPVLLAIVAALFRSPVRKESVTPSVSLIIAAYNEEKNIGQRLDNALSLVYPSSKLEILVASDGSNDSTDSIVSGFAPLVRLLRLPRRGKAHALNRAAERSCGEILVFSDANILYQRQTLLKLVRAFADPRVGGVVGNKIYRIPSESESISRGERLYWSYDKWLKSLESLSGSTVSADGAVYAIRRQLYQLPLDPAVTDDFALSTGVIEQGYRLIFEAEARAYEAASPTAEQEFSRKVRLMTRGLRGLILRKKLLNPFRFGFYSIILFSHKLLRRLVPFVLPMLLVSGMVLSSSGLLYASLTLLQILFYAAAAIGYVLRRQPAGQSKFLLLPFFYCLANACALLAFINLLRGRRIELWKQQRQEG